MTFLQNGSGDYLPSDPVLRDMMVRSYDILKDHPINVKRRAEGKNPANSAWFWERRNTTRTHLI